MRCCSRNSCGQHAGDLLVDDDKEDFRVRSPSLYNPAMHSFIDVRCWCSNNIRQVPPRSQLTETLYLSFAALRGPIIADFRQSSFQCPCSRIRCRDHIFH
ncbi:hypothetical protein CEXT_17481 [Caerostris extrusa]|uniref:Post-SET domain-containing protein n=1 Tax=Caerostris extrusa TaxID=172846 RepID=A0AAV4QVL6_CAEEX|nr:hypothetical protein CEXT_17481 [Caerostris extrusa]